jgi:hypothetical protein
MSDTQTEKQEEKPEGGAFWKWLTAGALAVLILPQDQIMRRILGPLWELISLKASNAKERILQAADWTEEKLRDFWSRLISFTGWFLFLAAASVAVGIVLKERTGWMGSHILVALGWVIGGLVLWAWDIIVYGLKHLALEAASGIETATKAVYETIAAVLRKVGVKMPTVAAATADSSAKPPVRRGSLLLFYWLAGLPMVLLPSWGTLWFVVIMAFLATVFRVLAKRFGWTPDAGLKVVAVLIAVLIAFYAIAMVMSYLLPEYAASFKLDDVQGWLQDPSNTTLKAIGLLVLIPLSVRALAFFMAEGKGKEGTLKFSAYLAVACAVIGVLLIVRGVITWNGIKGEGLKDEISEASGMTGVKGDSTANSDPDPSTGDGTDDDGHLAPPPPAYAGDGVHLAPPTYVPEPRRTVQDDPPAEPRKVSRGGQTVPTKPRPERKPKRYTSTSEILADFKADLDR